MSDGRCLEKAHVKESWEEGEGRRRRTVEEVEDDEVDDDLGVRHPTDRRDDLLIPAGREHDRSDPQREERPGGHTELGRHAVANQVPPAPVLVEHAVEDHVVVEAEEHEGRENVDGAKIVAEREPPGPFVLFSSRKEERVSWRGDGREGKDVPGRTR